MEMGKVNVRDVRNHGGEVLDRVTAGEVVIVERSGKPVAQVTRLPLQSLSTAELVERSRHFPPMEADACRRDDCRDGPVPRPPVGHSQPQGLRRNRRARGHHPLSPVFEERLTRLFP